MLKEKIYAWYPQVDVPDYTTVKPDSYEIECLYRQASKRHLEKERPPDNNIPPIGFRINRKSAQEEERELSPAEFLRRCKSAPLFELQQCEEISPRQLTKSYADPKTETKSFFEVPNEEKPVKPHSRPPYQDTTVANFDPKPSPRARPFSASFATAKRFEREQYHRKLFSSARVSGQIKAEPPANSLTVVVAPPVPADRNSDNPPSSVSKPLPVNAHSRSPCQYSTVGNFDPKSSQRVRPFSAPFVTGKRPETGQGFRKLSSAQASRQVRIEPPPPNPNPNPNTPTIVVTSKVPADSNSGKPTSSVSKLPPKTSAQTDILQNFSSNDVFGPQNSAARIVSSCTYRHMISSAGGRSKGVKQNGDSKETTKISGNKLKPSDTSNQRKTIQDESKIFDAQNPPGRHRNGSGIQNEDCHAVLGVDTGNKGDNRETNSQNKVPRQPKVNAGKSACTKRVNVRELAIKEIKKYNAEDYERSLRQNGWRMELQGNKFGLKKTPVRLPYWVPLAVPKVPERPPVFQTNSSNTFFYNTIPSRPKRINISQNWHSETGYEQRLANINRKRRGYHYRNWSFAY